MSELPGINSHLSIAVISKKGCHICEKAVYAIESLRSKFSFELSILDIEDDASLFDKYWIKVPVVRVNSVDVFDAEDIGLGSEWISKLERMLSDRDRPS